jgi:hypothetical protein
LFSPVRTALGQRAAPGDKHHQPLQHLALIKNRFSRLIAEYLHSVGDPFHLLRGEPRKQGQAPDMRQDKAIRHIVGLFLSPTLRIL